MPAFADRRGESPAPPALSYEMVVELTSSPPSFSGHRSQLCLNHFIETYDPTIEDSYRKQVSIDGQSCMLEVLDTAGQEDYTALRDQWVREGEGFVLVYSIASRSSFARIQNFHQHIQRVKGPATTSIASASAAAAGTASFLPASPSTMSSRVGAQSPIMLVGNKCDRGTDRNVSMQEGQALARSLGCDFVEASAKNCINVEKAFYDVVRALRRQRQAAMPRQIEYRGPMPPMQSGNEAAAGFGGAGAGAGGKGNGQPKKSHHQRIRCTIV